MAWHSLPAGSTRRAQSSSKKELIHRALGHSVGQTRLAQQCLWTPSPQCLSSGSQESWHHAMVAMCRYCKRGVSAVSSATLINAFRVPTRVSSAIALVPAHDTPKSSLLGWELRGCQGNPLPRHGAELSPPLPLQPHAHSRREGKTVFMENPRMAAALSVSLEGILHW